MIEKTTSAIEGAISQLSAKRTHRPRGYPFSKIRVFYIDETEVPFLKAVFPHVEFKPASNLESMVRLDFKKAGPVYKNNVKEIAKDLSKVPKEFLKVAEFFPEGLATTKCRKFLVEVEDEDMPELWDVICFKKAVKKYLTEDLGYNIVHPVFGGPEGKPLTYRVFLTLVNCKESLYQALEQYGKKIFIESGPFILNIPPRNLLPKLSESDHFIGGARLQVTALTKD